MIHAAADSREPEWEIGKEVMRFELSPGENIIELAPRESGVRLDPILVINDPVLLPQDRRSGRFGR